MKLQIARRTFLKAALAAPFVIPAREALGTQLFHGAGGTMAAGGSDALATAIAAASVQSWFPFGSNELTNVTYGNNAGDNNSTAADLCQGSSSPYTADIMAPWSGGYYAYGKKKFIAKGGGHNDSWDPTHYAFDMTTGKWAPLDEPADPGSGSCGAGNNPSNANLSTWLNNLDGSPFTFHTYGTVEWDQLHNIAIELGAGQSGGSSGGTNRAFTFDITKASRTSLPGPNSPGNGAYTQVTDLPLAALGASGGNTQGSICWDPNTNCLWFGNPCSFGVAKFNGASLPGNPWTVVTTPTTGSCSNAVGVIDTTRRRFYFIGAGLCGYFDINPSNFGGGGTTTTHTNVTTSGDQTVQNAAGPGLEYDATLDRIIGWASDGSSNRTLWTFNPATAAWSTSELPGGGSVSIHAPAGNGTFGRLRDLRPDYNALFLTNAENDPNSTYIYRLS